MILLKSGAAAPMMGKIDVEGFGDNVVEFRLVWIRGMKELRSRRRAVD
jgi:hypothetical protein